MLNVHFVNCRRWQWASWKILAWTIDPATQMFPSVSFYLVMLFVKPDGSCMWTKFIKLLLLTNASGVAVSALTCRSEHPWFDFTLGQNFFRLTRTGVNPASKKWVPRASVENKGSEGRCWHPYLECFSVLELWRNWHFMSLWHAYAMVNRF